MAANNNNRKPKPTGKTPKFNSYWIFLGIILLFLGINFFGEGAFGEPKTITPSQFEKYLEAGDVEKVEIIHHKTAQVFLKSEAKESSDHKEKETKEFLPSGKAPDYTFELGDLQNFENRTSEIIASNDLDAEITYENPSNFWGDLLPFLIPLGLFFLIWIFIMRRMSGGAGGGPGGQIFNIGKSKAKLFDQKNDIKVSFKNVAGMEGAKEEVEEVVDFLKNPDKYTSLGGKIPKGVMLVGPPGTGKTLLAKAVAGEAHVPFFSLSGSDFVEMFVGVGASRVRDLFKQAKAKAPSIIFIDEIDAIGRARGKGNFSGSNDERENTLNQLLTEMDGFGTHTNVIVIAATNRQDILDKALMRAGRFDRLIHVELPDVRERKEIFEVHLKPLTKVEDDLDVEFFAKQTPGFSGADIANVCNEAALTAARKGKKTVGKQDFLDAVDRIIGGLEKKKKIITPEEKRIIAFHEAGHATVSWMLEHAAPLVKVTIVPRGQSLGAAWYLPEERMIVRPEQILDEMCAALGGRAAEKIIFDQISTGALSDLEKVAKQAKSMITVYGLNEKLGNLTFYDSQGQSDYNFTKPYSEKTAELIDAEISKLIESQYQRALDLLEKHKDKLTELAELLLEREVIFKEDVEKIFGKPPHEIEAEEVESISSEETNTEEKTDTEEIKEENSDQENEIKE